MTTRAAYYTTQDIAERMAISEATVKRMCDSREMPGAVKVRGQWRINKAVFGDAEARSLKTGVLA